jgi:hypothetical protein
VSSLDLPRLKVELRRRLRDAVVLASLLPPVRWLLARAYGLALARLTRALAARPYVREVGLTGSLAAGDGVLGASDVDLIVIARGRADQGAKRDIRREFARARRVFPFIGETDERAGNLLFSTDVGTNPAAAVYACRRKAGSYRVLSGAPSGIDVGPGGAGFTPVEIVAEIALQLQAIATQTLAGSLNLYFWKSKIRVLDNLLRQSGGAGPRHAPPFDAAHAELLRELSETPNRRLYFRRRRERDALAWDVVVALVDALTAAHGLEQLATPAVDFRSTPARQLPVDARALPPGVRAHEYTRRPAGFGGDSVLDAPVLPYLLLEAENARWTTFQAACETSRAQAETALVLIWLGGWVFQLHRGRCRGVFSRFDRPWLFPDRFTAPGTLAFPRPFLDRLLAERDLDLDYLRDAFYWRVADPDATADPARHSDSLRYFEDRQRALNGFAFIHAARSLSREAIVNYGDRDQVFADAASRETGDNARLLGQLRHYARSLDEGTLAREGTRLPPALMRAARRLFADVLYGRLSGEGYDAGARLALSVCVCTKNRAALLPALLESVVAQTRRPDEVLLVDNGSTDDTAAVAARYARLLPLRHVVDDGDTIAKVRNRALRESSGEIVCFTDDDCVLHPGWLHFIEESFFLEDEIGIVGGQVFHHQDQPSPIDLFHRAYLGVRL